jgi:hypothetical protein
MYGLHAGHRDPAPLLDQYRGDRLRRGISSSHGFDSASSVAALRTV